MYLCCDNWPTCDGKVPMQDLQKDTEDRARAAGWHIWRGTTMGGFNQEVILCTRCVGKHRRPEPPARLTQDVPLFGEESGEAPAVGE